ncbi:MAG: putative beta-lysine N-acetyltransferase [Bacteroidales bacterium]
MKDYRGGIIMTDKIEKIGKKSIIQHGDHNKRIYLIKLDPQDVGVIIPQLNALARDQSYSKIFCKVPAWAAPVFNSDGFIMEAFIPHFYCGTENVCFMSKFLNSDRLLGMEVDQLIAFSSLLLEYKSTDLEGTAVAHTDESPVLRLHEELAEEISKLYDQVFKSYPFPITDPAYIRQTMQKNIRYYGVKERGRLIALSSAEMDPESRNVEMTDFATLPAARGKKLSLKLLESMEKEMKEAGMITLYTISRLNSFPMNKTFLNRGYSYSGTLINNTNIAGNIESMNVLYKHLN